MTSDVVAPEYEKYVVAQRRAGRLDTPEGPMASGIVTGPLRIDPATATRLIRVAALRAAGIFRSSTRTTVVWIEGDSQLAVVVAEITVELADGVIAVVLPVRCDQVGTEQVRATFVVGAPGRPAGLYAAAERRPRGPQLVVDAWGEAIVAFAWQCLLGLISGLAGAVGKDARGNLLVPVELEASPDGLVIVPMARHRFSGSSGLT